MKKEKWVCAINTYGTTKINISHHTSQIKSQKESQQNEVNNYAFYTKITFCFFLQMKTVAMFALEVLLGTDNSVTLSMCIP